MLTHFMLRIVCIPTEVTDDDAKDTDEWTRRALRAYWYVIDHQFLKWVEKNQPKASEARKLGWKKCTIPKYTTY
jgi:hypothetical protein